MLLVHATVGSPAVRASDSGVEQSDKPDSRIIASPDPRRNVHIGDRLTLAVDMNGVHFFDPETGEVLGR